MRRNGRLVAWGWLAAALAGTGAAGQGRTTGFVEVPQGRLWYEAAGQGEALVLWWRSRKSGGQASQGNPGRPKWP